MTLRDVESTKSIVRLRIGGTPPRDGRSDPCLDQLETPKHMDQRRIGDAPTPTLRRKRWRESTGVCRHSLGAVDAANAQNAAGLLLFPRANHLFLIRRHTGLAGRLARLETSRSLWPTGSRSTHRLRGLGSSRAPTRSTASRGRRGRVLALTIGTREAESGLFQDRRTGGNGQLDLERRVDNQIEGGLELAAQRRPDIGNRPVLWGWERDVEEDRLSCLGERPGQRVGGNRWITQETREQRREEPVFVFRPLRPRRDEVGELEAARRRPALGDQSGIAGIAADVLPHHFTLVEVFADVVEVKVDGGRVAPRRPFFVRCVEGDVGL